jgi:hypothetical protein
MPFVDRHYTAHTLLLNAFHASGGMTHFMQCFDQVVAFYLENYAAKAGERQKQREASRAQQHEPAPLQFHLEPMDIDHSSSSSSSNSSASTFTPATKTFDEEVSAVETTLTW